MPMPLPIPSIKYEALTPEVTEKKNKDVIAGLERPYVYMGLSWQDYLTLGKYMQDIKSKFMEYNALLCHYRKELEECK